MHMFRKLNGRPSVQWCKNCKDQMPYNLLLQATNIFLAPWNVMQNLCSAPSWTTEHIADDQIEQSSPQNSVTVAEASFNCLHAFQV